MYCQKCGSKNLDNSWKCVTCGDVLQQNDNQHLTPQVIPNYLVQSILATLFCCLPFGIVAIVYSAQVNGKVQLGDIQGALEISKKAKLWSWIAFGVGLFVSMCYFALMAIGAAVENKQ